MRNQSLLQGLKMMAVRLTRVAVAAAVFPGEPGAFRGAAADYEKNQTIGVATTSHAAIISITFFTVNHKHVFCFLKLNSGVRRSGRQSPRTIAARLGGPAV